jgi:hypothetical protein
MFDAATLVNIPDGEKGKKIDHPLGYPVVGPMTFLQRSLLLLKKETSR